MTFTVNHFYQIVEKGVVSENSIGFEDLILRELRRKKCKGDRKSISNGSRKG